MRNGFNVKTITALSTIALLVACGKMGKPAEISQNCTTNGYGQVQCTFMNKGETEGSKCVKLVLVNTSMYNKKQKSREVCSGLVKAGDVVERRESGVFETTPDAFCSGVFSTGPWNSNCHIEIE